MTSRKRYLSSRRGAGKKLSKEALDAIQDSNVEIHVNKFIAFQMNVVIFARTKGGGGRRSMFDSTSCTSILVMFLNLEYTLLIIEYYQQLQYV
jgi:hypothetical protein